MVRASYLLHIGAIVRHEFYLKFLEFFHLFKIFRILLKYNSSIFPCETLRKNIIFIFIRHEFFK